MERQDPYELDDPTQERACQNRAKGMTQNEAYAEAFKVPPENNNGSRFFRQPHIAKRVAQIKRRISLLAELDEGFVLSRLKTIANYVDANLDDYFAKNEAGERIHTDIASVSRKKMALLDEVTVEEFVERQGDELERIRKTKLKLRPVSTALTALRYIGEHIGMWPAKSAGTLEITGKNGGPVVMEDVSIEQRAKALAVLMGKVGR